MLKRLIELFLILPLLMGKSRGGGHHPFLPYHPVPHHQVDQCVGCVPTGEHCKPECNTCCGRDVCNPDGRGLHRCSPPQCIPLEGLCNSISDCCNHDGKVICGTNDYHQCRGGKCSLVGYPNSCHVAPVCRQNGEKCQFDAGCCDGICKDIGHDGYGTCGRKCADLGHSCIKDSSCCNPDAVCGVDYQANPICHIPPRPTCIPIGESCRPEGDTCCNYGTCQKTIEGYSEHEFKCEPARRPGWGQPPARPHPQFGGYPIYPMPNLPSYGPAMYPKK